MAIQYTAVNSRSKPESGDSKASLKVKRVGIAFVFAATLYSPEFLTAQKGPSEFLLAISKDDHTLSMVDPASLQVVAKMPVGEDPHEVVASTDGRTAYVSNYGGGSFHTIAVLDLVARKALPSIDLGPLSGPHGLMFFGGKLWFTVEGSKAIGSYDPVAKKVDWVLGTGQNRTHMIYVFPDEQHIVTTNVASGTVSLIEQLPPQMPPPPAERGGPHVDWNEVVVRVGNGSEGFDISPDAKEIWVGNSGDGTISVIDRASKTVVQTLKADIPGVNRLKFTPDGQHVLVSTLSGPDLLVLDAHTREQVKRIPLGHGCAGVLVQPDGSRAFVGCTLDNYIAVIDLGSLNVVGQVKVGGEPDGLAWATR